MQQRATKSAGINQASGFTKHIHLDSEHPYLPRQLTLDKIGGPLEGSNLRKPLSKPSTTTAALASRGHLQLSNTKTSPLWCHTSWYWSVQVWEGSRGMTYAPRTHLLSLTSVFLLQSPLAPGLPCPSTQHSLFFFGWTSPIPGDTGNKGVSTKGSAVEKETPGW